MEEVTLRGLETHLSRYGEWLAARRGAEVHASPQETLESLRAR
jgi:hypothetical protein